MLDAVMLILREVLEAVLSVSLLLALGLHLELRARWAAVAVPLGLLASWMMSAAAYALASAFGGIGQELTNAALYAVAIAAYGTLATLVVPYAAAPARPLSRRAAWAILASCVAVVACSMAREGSEVWIYLSGFAAVPTEFSAAITGGLIGLGIGLSLGALVYYGLSFLPRPRFLRLFVLVAALIVGGMSMQLARQGLQIGWLDSGRALWDSSFLVPERSWTGQLLHALLGYDANPDLTQASFYFGALALLAAALVWRTTCGAADA
jgi:high-affinity iron transporter